MHTRTRAHAHEESAREKKREKRNCNKLNMQTNTLMLGITNGRADGSTRCSWRETERDGMMDGIRAQEEKYR